MPRLPLLVFLIVATTLATTLAGLSQQPEIVSLPDASWQFHAGDDPRCATVSGMECALQSSDNSFEPLEWQRSVINLPNSLRTPQQLGQLMEGENCFYEVFVNGRKITLANAGHLNPYCNGTELSVPGSLPLGLSSDAIYTSEHFSLEAGDHLTFVSDGVVESTGLKGELFGFERTAALSRESARSIASAAQSFGAGTRADDITVLTVDCMGTHRQSPDES